MKAATTLVLCLLVKMTLAQSSINPFRDTSSPNGVNYFVDSPNYWELLRAKGLILRPAPLELPPPVYKGGRIADGHNVKFPYSHDYPLTDEKIVSQTEPSIFATANVILNSGNTSYLNGGIRDFRGANHAESYTQGLSWLPEFKGLDGGNSGDPVAFGNRHGDLFVAYMKRHGVFPPSSYDNILAFSISNDNGSTWETKNFSDQGDVFVDPGMYTNKAWDKPHATADRHPQSPYVDRLYFAFTLFAGSDLNIIHSGHEDVFFTKMVPQGNNFAQSNCVNLSNDLGDRNMGVNLSTGPAGEVYAVWSVHYDGIGTLEEQNFGFTKSIDGGASFTPAQKIFDDGFIRGTRNTDNISWANNGFGVRVTSNPVIAVIQTGAYQGRIGMVWTNRGLPGNNSDPETSVYFVYSDDQGETWSPPIRVNTDPFGNNKRFFPWLTSDPVTGTLSVVFYDNRECGGNQFAAWVANSFDGGTTWDDFAIGDHCFMPQGIEQDPTFIGDYLGISSFDNIVYPIWTSNHEGRPRLYCSPYVLSPPGWSPRLENDMITLRSGKLDGEYEVEIKNDTDAQINLVVSDLMGRVITHHKMDSRDAIYPVDLKNEPEGIYLFKTFTNGGVQIIKVLKSKIN